MPVRLPMRLLGIGCAVAGFASACSTSPEQAAPPSNGSTVVIGGAAPTTRPAPFARDLGPYGGAGAWIDVFDYAPNYTGGSPALSPADLPEMQRRGVRTVYLQATRWDDDSPQGIVDGPLLGQFLRGAHQLGMRVVGWYLPDFKDVDRDLARTLQIRDFQDGDERFDGVAVDIEYTEGVPDPVQRNEALVVYSRRLRSQVGDLPVAAVVLTAVHLEVVNPRFWPDFPYAKLADLYDVWMPMAYWSGRVEKYHSGYTYVKESVDRLRNNLGKPDAPVSPVGGIADEITNDEIRDFGRALRDMKAIGGSLYDWSTSAPNKQATFARLFAAGGVAADLPAPPGVGPHPVFSEADLTTTTTAPPTTVPPSTEPPSTEPPPEPTSTEAPTTATPAPTEPAPTASVAASVTSSTTAAPPG